MIEQMTDMPENVVGFRATGKVTKNEFDRILIPAVDALADRAGELRYLFVLDTDVSNMSIGAWYDDMLVGAKHLLQWKKIAIVTDQPNVNKVTEIAAHVMPGEVRAYKIAELEVARNWLAA